MQHRSPTDGALEYDAHFQLHCSGVTSVVAHFISLTTHFEESSQVTAAEDNEFALRI